MKVGIIGAGWIAEKMALTIQGLKDVESYAIAPRSSDKAEDFKSKFGMTKAFAVNEAQAAEMIDLSKKNGLLLAEAIWTRYMPSRKIKKELAKKKDIQVDVVVEYTE